MCHKGLNKEDQEKLKKMITPHVKKLQFLFQHKLDCKKFEKAVIHMFNVLFDKEFTSLVEAKYASLFLFVFSQLVRTTYSSCLPKLQHKFYLLNQKIKSIQ